MQPGTAVIKGGQLHMQLCEMTHSSSGVVQVWGPKPVLGGSSGSGGGAVAGEYTTYILHSVSSIVSPCNVYTCCLGTRLVMASNA